MVKLGKLKEIKNLRDIWPHEALNFTPWLAQDENIAMLADAVGLEITVEEVESGVGDFNVDIYASETGTDRKIIIENQLEETDHDHLGKLITYASGKSADVIIWVVKKAREEHRAAIEWLNSRTDEKIGFFLVETKLYQIGSSDIAVKFEVVEKPNDWVKEIKKYTNNSPILEARYEYWSAFNNYAYNNTMFANEFKKRKPSTDHWMTLGVGVAGQHIALLQIRKYNHVLVEWYIDDDKEMFKKLYSYKNEIEKEIGISLEWNELPEKKASRIIAYIDADFTNKENWNYQFEWMMNTAVKFKKAFKKYI